MENRDKSKFNNHLRERTMQMAAKLYWLLKDRKVSWIIRPGVNQIIRSSSSVAANFRAAARARSDAEFYAKICIVVEECDETLFWLEYLIRINLLYEDKTKEIYSEVEQLVRLFNAIKSKMKIKIGAKNVKSEIGMLCFAISPPKIPLDPDFPIDPWSPICQGVIKKPPQRIGAASLLRFLHP